MKNRTHLLISLGALALTATFGASAAQPAEGATPAMSPQLQAFRRPIDGAPVNLRVGPGDFVLKPRCRAGTNPEIILVPEDKTPPGMWAAKEAPGARWTIYFDGAPTPYRVPAMLFCQ
jgi:hypothetical protein